MILNRWEKERMDSMNAGNFSGRRRPWGDASRPWEFTEAAFLARFMSGKSCWANISLAAASSALEKNFCLFPCWYAPTGKSLVGATPLERSGCSTGQTTRRRDIPAFVRPRCPSQAKLSHRLAEFRPLKNVATIIETVETSLRQLF